MIVWTQDGLLDEFERLADNKARCLKALELAGDHGVTNVMLMRVAGSRAGGRVHELRQDGYVIDCQHEGRGTYRYTLRSRPTVDRWPVKARVQAKAQAPTLRRVMA